MPTAEEKKQFIAQTFDDVAARYDSIRFFHLSAEHLIDCLEVTSVSHAPRRALDLSTGTGIVATALAARDPQLEIHAVDLSVGMLAQARQKAETRQLRPIQFAQMDVEYLAFPPAHFDFITCGYGMFFYPGGAETLGAICKHLKPHGRLVFSTFTEAAFAPYSDLFLDRIGAYDQVEIPDRTAKMLKTESDIQAFCADVTGAVAVVQKPIRYAMALDDWWALLNNAGYKGLLDQLTAEQLLGFKEKHLRDVEAAAGGETFELNVDSWYTIIDAPA